MIKIRGWDEHRNQRVIQTGDGQLVASRGDFVIVIVCQQGDRPFKVLDEMLAEQAKRDAEAK